MQRLEKGDFSSACKKQQTVVNMWQVDVAKSERKLHIVVFMCARTTSKSREMEIKLGKDDEIKS